MKKYLNDYVKEIDALIESGDINEKFIMEHLVKIGFFQHERLIHLFVTLFYALFVFIMFAFSLIYRPFFLIFLVLIIFLIFYIRHYFELENKVQYLYKQYDIMRMKQKK